MSGLMQNRAFDGPEPERLQRLSAGALNDMEDVDVEASAGTRQPRGAEEGRNQERSNPRPRSSNHRRQEDGVGVII